MAYSSAQHPICLSCEKPEVTRWKCFNCENFLCDTCKKVHSKIGHDVVSSMDGNINTSKPRLKEVSCHDHGDHKFINYCSTCNKLVCPKCLAIDNSHGNHKLELLDTFFEDRVQYLDTRAKKIKEDILPVIKQNAEKVSCLEYYHKEMFEKEKQKILEQDRQLREKLSEVTDNCVEQLKESYDRIDAVLSEQKMKMGKIESSLLKNLTEIKECEISGNVTEILQTEKKVCDGIENCENHMHVSLPQDTLKYSAAAIDSRSLKSALGSLTLCNIFVENLNVETITSVDCEAKYDSSVVCSKDGTIYISGDQGIGKIEPSEKHVKQIMDNLHGIYDTGILNSDELVVLNGCKIFKLDSKMKLTTYYNVPDCPVALHVSRNGQLMLLIINSTFPRSVAGAALLIYLGKHSKVFQVICLSKDLKSSETLTIEGSFYESNFMTDRKRLSQNINDGIIISSKLKNKVWGFDHAGKVIWRYEKLVLPEDIATTFLGNIIICDQSESGLHILNSSGNLLTRVDSKNLGIQGVARSMYFKNNEEFVVLCPGKVYVLKLTSVV